MHRLLHHGEALGPAGVSTGRLPQPQVVAAPIDEAHERCGGVAEGRVADYIPALAAASPGWFGLCIAGVDGAVFAAGDADRPLSIQSISKPFVFALVCQAGGGDGAGRA